MRILVVEDEQKVADALREGLVEEHYDVVVERTGEAAFFRINTENFDVILLDLGLPGRDGLEILSALRQRGTKTPVLVLTARDTLEDRVTGLDGGADDYLVNHLRSRKCWPGSGRCCAAAGSPSRSASGSAISRSISCREKSRGAAGRSS